MESILELVQFNSKPSFLVNATSEAAEQFMAIFLAQEIDISRKLIELDILIGTMREDVQVTW